MSLGDIEAPTVGLRGISFWRTNTRLDPGKPGGRMPRFFRDNGLTIVAFSLFVVAFAFQALTGWQVYAHDHPIGFWPYLRSWHFLEATMENWESEFLQMGVFVVLTGHLFQRGSADSKDPDHPDEAPPARANWWYEHSLSLALFTLFAISFALHAVGGVGVFNEDEHQHLSVWQFLLGPTFWFQSMQNWQSEFLSVGALTVLSIFLRERGSTQSKPVDAPDGQTGC
ncbi:MAG: hypothetical protein JWM80_4181 [Cyanobacteria bacterium RYN_339]|nr:hypothetical protein [Cyanobacteria bacterium RYN_339]